MEKPSVLFLPLASQIHVERVPGPILRGRTLLEDSGLVVFGPRKPIRDITEFPKLNPDEYDAVVIFIASGGTGGLTAELMRDRPWFLWAYHENNSLPSALTARVKLMAAKAWKGRLLFSNLSSAPPEILAEAFACRALKSINGYRVGYIGDEEEFNALHETVKFLKDKFDVESVFIPTEELKKALDYVDRNLVQQVIREKLKRAEVVEPSQGDIEKSIRLYVTLKGIIDDNRLNGITLDCYKFLRQAGVTPCFAFSFLSDEGNTGVCEGDLALAPVMFLLTNLSGKPVWLANTSKMDQRSGIMTFAHCSAPTRLSEPAGLIRIRSHFESGLGATLDVPLRKGAVSIIHAASSPQHFIIAKGELIESQLSHWKLSRTQADVRLECDAEEFLNVTGNHQVISYGDYVPVLERIGERLGIETRVLKAEKN